MRTRLSALLLFLFCVSAVHAQEKYLVPGDNLIIEGVPKIPLGLVDKVARYTDHGQRLALDPLWPEKATIGGMLSANDSGALRLRFGALRDLIIGATIALPDGTLASSGGKVVKNVAGYDLPKLVTGALGTLGIITRAVFRLHPLPRNTRAFSVSAADAEAAQQFVLAVQNSKLAHTFLQSHFFGRRLSRF